MLLFLELACHASMQTSAHSIFIDQFCGKNFASKLLYVEQFFIWRSLKKLS